MIYFDVFILFLRRLLKLMHHRIKPVFVFDGERPSLNKDTLKKRRLLVEQGEMNYKKAAERILLHQMKERLLRPRTARAVPSNILPTFHPLKSVAEDEKEEIVAGLQRECGHSLCVGSKVRVSLAINERVMQGTIAYEPSSPSLDSSLSECRQSVGVMVSGSEGESDIDNSTRLGKSSQHFFLSGSSLGSTWKLIDPCEVCFPEITAVTSPKPAAPSSTTKSSSSLKRKAQDGNSGREEGRRQEAVRRGRLYDKESDGDDESLELSGGSDSESEWVLPASGGADIDIDTLARCTLLAPALFSLANLML